MVTLAQRTAFQASEDVLRDEVLPAEVFAYVVKHLVGRKEKLPQNVEEGRKAALRTCREQRAKRWHQSRRYADDSIQAVLDINRQLAQASPLFQSQRVNEHTELNMNDQPKVTIDEKDYLIENLSDEVKAQLGNLNVVDKKIADMKQYLAIMQTARNAYARALTAALPKEN